MTRMHGRWRAWCLMGAWSVGATAPTTSLARDAAQSIPPTAGVQAGEPEVQRSYRTTCELGGKEGACEVRLTVNKAVATVADRIEVVLEARVPDIAKVEWPPIGASLGELNVLGVEDQEPIVLELGEPGTARRKLVRRVVLLEPFLPGERELPAMSVRFVGAGGASCVLVAGPVKIEIKSLLEGEAKEPELRGVVEPKKEATAWWVWAAGGAGAVALTGVLAVALRRRGERAPEVLTPYGAAMKRLETLEESGMLDEGKCSEYCTVLGETLRAYVGGVMSLPAADRTTEQLLGELGDQPSVNMASLGELLARLDEASFAGTPVGVGEAQELRDKVHKMIVGMQAARTAAEAAAPDAPKGGA